MLARRAGQANALGMVFGWSGGGLSDTAKTCTELHENAAHDGTVGALGDDFCNAFCPVNNETWWPTDFCANCITALKNRQQLEN